ncbi:alginate export family protein [Pinirhizobacter sp.]|uniref:alginate export family protein n=1 Tax=Pinirhizobacter sp. TaxID=2950432 RepID=UPI002F423D55
MQSVAERPALLGNRWQEDWSALADPSLRTQGGDTLKYISLSSGDPKTYLSLGVNLRERTEMSDAVAFGLGSSPNATYLLKRFQLHADIRFANYWQAFVQFEDAHTLGKQVIGGADRNSRDLRLAFVAYARPLADGMFKARVGRQDFAFDLQRFLSLRDGPNVRQSFDAIWAALEIGPWRFIGLLSQPVQYKDGHPFDDTSNRHFRLNILRVERWLQGGGELSAYYALYSRDNPRYLDAVGNERRDIYDVRYAGQQSGVDWDLEGMAQRGRVGAKDIDAWGTGARVGYTWSSALSPRLGLQVDAASGNRRRGDGTLSTFNPLFPNGYYFTAAAFTGYTNLVHIKSGLTVKPTTELVVMGAVGFQWRQTTADAIYVQPDISLPGTAGSGGRWTGAYGQVRVDYAFNANVTGTVEAVHYDVGRTIRMAGGRDGDYVGVEGRFTW